MNMRVVGCDNGGMTPQLPYRLVPLVLAGTLTVTPGALAALDVLRQRRGTVHDYVIYACEQSVRNGHADMRLDQVLEEVLLEGDRRRPLWVPRHVHAEVTRMGYTIKRELRRLIALVPQAAA